MCALAALGRTDEAIHYAEASRGLNDSPVGIAEELAGELVSGEPAEESPESHCQLARELAPGDDDTRVPPTGLAPLALSTFDGGPVVGQQDPVCIDGDLRLILVDTPEMPGIPRYGHREAPGA